MPRRPSDFRKAKRRQRYGRDVVKKRPEQVLLDGAVGHARERQCFDDLLRPAPDQNDAAGIGAVGVLNADAFHIGAAAADAEDRIVYNSATGQLFFDSNGNAPAARPCSPTSPPGWRSATRTSTSCDTGLRPRTDFTKLVRSRPAAPHLFLSFPSGLEPNKYLATPRRTRTSMPIRSAVPRR